MLRVGQVGSKLIIKHRGIRLHGLLNIDSRWQWLVIDLNQIEGIAGYIGVLSNNDGNRIAIEAYLALSQWTTSSHTFFNMGGKQDANRHLPNLPLEILGSIDGHHTRECKCGLCLDPIDACMPI